MKFYTQKLILFWMLTHTSTAQNNNAETKQKVNELIHKYNLKFGVSTSAFQIEGAWNGSGAGETLWGRYTLEHPERIPDRSNAQISCDSFHNLERDIKMLKFLGVKFYRFSISWARLLPKPILHNGVSQAALQYYHNLIDQLKANNITPVVTLFHYDMPISVSDFGGWTNAKTIKYFEHFARIVFDNFADKVDVWVTFNGFDNTCSFLYGSDMWPPITNEAGVAVYLCIRNILMAHARVYNLYKYKYNSKNEGVVGMIYKLDWYEPLTNSTEDLEFITKFRKMTYGIFYDPIFSEHGDYPEIVKETVARKSKEQGFNKSRLELLTNDEVKYIHNTSDFFGVSYYTQLRIYRNPMEKSNDLASQIEFKVRVPSFFDDINYYIAPRDPNWEPTEISRIMNSPEGLKQSLLYIKNTYNNPKVFLLENGCGTPRDSLDNHACVNYFKGHLDAIYDAVVNEGCNVQMYGIWSLMDNFEWESGYINRFGLFHTNFTDEKRSTQPKETAYFFKEILDG